MRRHLRDRDCRIIAVDNAEAMTVRCREYLAAQDSMMEELVPATVVHGDILTLELEPCSVVVLNFTLQFIAPEHRLALLTRIRQALLPGGVLILSEKFRFAESLTQQHLEQVHYAFKRANGYSDLEIAQKRSAIENVMLLDTQQAHSERLQAAGFGHVCPWFQCCRARLGATEAARRPAPGPAPLAQGTRRAVLRAYGQRMAVGLEMGSGGPAYRPGGQAGGARGMWQRLPHVAHVAGWGGYRQ